MPARSDRPRRRAARCARDRCRSGGRCRTAPSRSRAASHRRSPGATRPRAAGGAPGCRALRRAARASTPTAARPSRAAARCSTSRSRRRRARRPTRRRRAAHRAGAARHGHERDPCRIVGCRECPCGCRHTGAPVTTLATHDTTTTRRFDPALVVILAGVAAALHVGKLPPAIPALQSALGLTLLQAGFLLSMLQAAGMCAGVAFGALADGLGLKRSMLIGLAVLSLASVLGGASTHVALLLALRAAEGFGFLLVVLPAPGLVRRLVPPARTSLMLGVWSAYMPLATASALLVGPLWIGAFDWRSWWWLLAAVTAAAALWLARVVPALQPGAATSLPQPQPHWIARLRQTLGA